MDVQGRMEDLFKRRKWTMALVLAALLMGVVFATSLSTPEQGPIKVSGAYALYPLMTVWAEEYYLETDIRVEVSGGGAGKGMSDVLADMVDIAMVSRDIFPEERVQGAFPIAVCKDAVIPTINANNPVAQRLMETGVSREQLEKVFITREITTWGELVGDYNVTDRIRVYTRADSCGAAETWAQFLGESPGDYNQDHLTAKADTAVMHDPDLAHAIAGDRMAIGYNNVNFAYDISTGRAISGLAVLPLDLDGNGTLDAEEDFYNTKAELLEAIGVGLYPSPPARILYLVGHNGLGEASQDFVRWILADGQAYVEAGGYIPLPEWVIEEQILLLEDSDRDKIAAANTLYTLMGIALIASLSVAAILETTTEHRKKDELIYIILMRAAVLMIILIASALFTVLLAGAAPLLGAASWRELLFSSNWNPRAGGFGYYPIITGTVVVTGLAMLISIPVSLLASIYIAEYAPLKWGDGIRAFVDVLAGIPSVVYGMCGILVLVPFVRDILGPFFGVETTGFCILTASLVLAVMVFPIIISITVEGLRSFPQHSREASFSLGASKWQTVKHVVVRGSTPAMLSAVLLGFGRALGETMAVAMLVGNLPRTPSSVFSPGMTLPSFIASTYGEMMSVPLYDSAVMLAALMLLIVVTLFNIAARIIMKRSKKRWQ